MMWEWPKHTARLSRAPTARPHQQALFPDFPAGFLPKGSFRLITKCGVTCPAACPARWCQRGFGTWGVCVLLSLLFLTPSFCLTLCSLLSAAPHGDKLPVFQEPGGKHLHCMSTSPTSTGSAGGHNPRWGGTHPSMLPDCHVWRPSAALEDLGGPYLAVPICTQPKTCGFCGRTLISFTPVINFSLVISCSTYKVQLISYCLPGFEDCITEVQFCLSGVQGKKGEMKILSIFPLIVKTQSKRSRYV